MTELTNEVAVRRSFKAAVFILELAISFYFLFSATMNPTWLPSFEPRLALILAALVTSSLWMLNRIRVAGVPPKLTLLTTAVVAAWLICIVLTFWHTVLIFE